MGTLLEQNDLLIVGREKLVARQESETPFHVIDHGLSDAQDEAVADHAIIAGDHRALMRAQAGMRSDRQAGKWERECLQNLEEALADFDVLRAGAAGLFKLSHLGEAGEDDPLCGSARTWVSTTPYRPTRHTKDKSAVADALEADVVSECARRNLPRPNVNVSSLVKGPRGGVRAHVRLAFAVAVAGPILLGQDAHEGGGVFQMELEAPR